MIMFSLICLNFKVDNLNIHHGQGKLSQGGNKRNSEDRVQDLVVQSKHLLTTLRLENYEYHSIISISRYYLPVNFDSLRYKHSRAFKIHNPNHCSSHESQLETF